MNLTSETFVKKILREKKIQPSKKLGQNFLISSAVREKIIQAAQLKRGELVVEVGPGPGTLTQVLAPRAKRVIAIEKDPQMVGVLREVLQDYKNVEIVQGDILKIVNRKLKIENSYKVVANLPYYIAAAVIRKFLQSPTPPAEMILMVQKEVAERITARPPRMNKLALAVQFYAEAKIIAAVSKNCFWPRPKVDSAILKIILRQPTAGANPDLLFKIIRAGFLHPRKQLVNNLASGLKLEKDQIRSWLENNQINPHARAETLKLEEWINFTKSPIINNDQ